MNLFIFGSTGNLVIKRVVPALSQLNFKGEVFALGRRELDNAGYLDMLGSKPEFKLNYLQVDFSKLDIKEFDENEENLVYISLPPGMIFFVLEYLAGLNYKFRILVEKPFGSNLEDALRLEKLINTKKLNVGISDHYLFKPEVLSLKKKEFSSLRIVSLESLGTEARKYYDGVGAVKDMVQSHFFNILFKLIDFNEKDVKIERVDFGQYRGYAEEIGHKSKIETFARIKLDIKGRKVEFITGKKFDKKLAFLELDSRKVSLLGSDDYKLIFSDFIAGRKDNFPKISDALIAWKITEKILGIKTKLEKYDDNVSSKLVIERKILNN